MSITTLHDLLATWEAEKQAERDATKVTPSATNTYCRRQLAYQLNLTTPTDEPDPVSVATVGSLLDVGIGLLWEQDPDTVGTQVRCHGGGTADVVQGELADDDGPPENLIVRDTKSVARTKFDRWLRNDGPPDNVWDQPMVYAGRVAMGPAALVVIDAICRESGRCATYTRPFDWEQWQAAEQRLTELQAEYTNADPDTAPADRDGRGDWVCDSCPWATRCLGPDDRPNNSTLPEVVVAEAAAEYLKWNAIHLDAQAKAKAAQNLLRGNEGTFGGWKVTWRPVAGTYIEGYDRKPYTVLKVQEAKP